MNALSQTLEYLKQDLPICLCVGKNPGVGGMNWHLSSPTESDVRKHFSLHGENASAGIKLGEKTGYIDIEGDGPDAENVWNMLNTVGSETACWKSSRGLHRLFLVSGPQFARLRAAGAGASIKMGDLEVRLGTPSGSAMSVLPPHAGREWVFKPPAYILPDEIVEKLVTHLGGRVETRLNDPPESLDRPGDYYNRDASWNEILEPLGWICVDSGDTSHWRRPGKSDGISATTGFCGSETRPDCLYIFSTSPEVAPFESGKTYTKFEAYTCANFDGDFSRASASLRDSGYGMTDREIIDLFDVIIPENIQSKSDNNEFPPLPREFFDNPIGQYALAVHDRGDESPPESIYLQALTAFGACLGKSVWMPTAGGNLYPNDFLVVVGKTGEGRKGTAWNHAKKLFNRESDMEDTADQTDDITNRFNSIFRGRVDSGEGLIKQIHNCEESLQKFPSLLIQDSEIAGLFKKAKIQNSTLPDSLLKFWDCTAMSIAKSKEQIFVKNVCGSIVGHIQPEILCKECVDQSFINSGLINRLQFIFVKRPRIRMAELLTQLKEDEVDGFRVQVEAAWKFAFQNSGVISIPDAELKRIRKIYEASQTSDRDMKLHERFFDHFLKLVIKLTVLRCSRTVNKSDIDIALGIQEWIAKHTNILIGEHVGNYDTDDKHSVLSFLRDNIGKSFTKTDIRRQVFFSRRKSSEMDEMLNSLLDDEKIKQITVRKTVHYTYP